MKETGTNRKPNLFTPANIIVGSILSVLLLAVLTFQACSGNSGNSAESPNSASGTLTISPSIVTVVPNATTYFTASGGFSPYTYTVSIGGGSVDMYGQYTAPASTGSSTIQVKDASGNSAWAYVTISTSAGSGGTLNLSPLSPTVSVGNTVSFSVSGGTSPYSYTTTGGSMSGNVLTAPGTAGTYQVYAYDSSGRSSSTSVYVINSSTSATATTVVSRSIQTMTNIQSGCTVNSGSSDACSSAIHRFCSTQGFATGFGPVEINTENFVGVCLPASKTGLMTVSFGTLSGYQTNCNNTNPVSAGCSSAINRHCVANGFAGGFGAIEHDNDNAIIACLTSGGDVTPINSAYSTLIGSNDGCNTSSPFGTYCNSAIHRYCAATGYQSGFGPVENSGDNANIICVR